MYILILYTSYISCIILYKSTYNVRIRFKLCKNSTFLIQTQKTPGCIKQ